MTYQLARAGAQSWSTMKVDLSLLPVLERQIDAYIKRENNRK
jgi:hypothetical protein